MNEDPGDDEEEVIVPGYGHATPGRDAAGDDAGSVYLYVPDLAAETGWNVYRVNRNDERRSRPIGFGRR